MNKKYLGWALLFVFCLTGIAFAKPGGPGGKWNPNPGPGPGNNGPGEKLSYYGNLPAQTQAREVLMRTARYLEQAQNVSRRSYNRQGLGQAISHQRQAREYYRDGWFERAIAHSIRARKIAIQIIQKNRGRIDDRRPFDDYDERFFKIYSDNDLDVSIRSNMMNDDDALQIYIDLD